MTLLCDPTPAGIGRDLAGDAFPATCTNAVKSALTNKLDGPEARVFCMKRSFGNTAARGRSRCANARRF